MEKIQINFLKEIKYKFYSFFLLIGIIFSFNYLQDLNNEIQNLKKQINSISHNLSSKKKELENLKEIKQKINFITKQKKDIISCIN